MTLRVFWNPGHGGRDPGAVGNGLQEKDIVLDIAKRADKYLKENYEGFTSKIFRSGDQFYSLSRITQEANAWNADIFVSIHVNAGGGTGFESFIYNGGVSSKTIQYQSVIHDEILKQVSGVRDRRKKRANYQVLRQTSMPAILTENMFIDTKADADKLKRSSFIESLAKGHAEGVAKALGLKKKKKEVPKVEDNTPSPWAKDAIEKAIRLGITDGSNLHRLATREEVITMIVRMYELDKN